jgi:DNA-binding NtrC family response regulator
MALPALRKRAGDIPELVAFFIAKFNRRLNKAVGGIEAEAMDVLKRHRWPGNIRELENVIERAVLFADTSDIRVVDLPNDVMADGQPVSATSAGGLDVAAAEGGQALTGNGLKEQVKAMTNRLEKQLIVRALDQTGGNVTHAARLLKISRKGLQLKMKELDLREHDE